MHRFLLWAGRVPRFVAIGERDPQRQIRVTLHGPGGPIDVTRNHVVAGLRPLTVAFTLPPPAAAAIRGERLLRLRLSTESDPTRPLAELGLRHEQSLEADGATLQLLAVTEHRDFCMPAGAATIFALHHARSQWRRRRPEAFQMEPRDLKALQALYICPRPVVLVSVQHGHASNLFPMDLIGPTDSPYFLLALRNASPAVRLMAASRRMALADVPLECSAVAYRLGEHHNKEHIDWNALPFETRPSPAHHLPVFRDALRVRDVEVRQLHVVGSHTLFVTEVVHEARWNDGLQMFHVSGPYYRYVVLRGGTPPRPPNPVGSA